MSATNSLPTAPQTPPSTAAAESLKLSQILAERLSIQSNDWHRLKSNRKVRALEQAAAAIVFLLKDHPEEALVRLQQAVGWLDRSISAPPCPTHGHSMNASEQISLNSQAENYAD